MIWLSILSDQDSFFTYTRLTGKPTHSSRYRRLIILQESIAFTLSIAFDYNDCIDIK